MSSAAAEPVHLPGSTGDARPSHDARTRRSCEGHAPASTLGGASEGSGQATLTRPEERTSTRPHEPIDPHVDQHRPGNRFLFITIAVLALVLIGLGAWTIVDRSSTSETAVTADIQQLIDDYTAAWNDYDGVAFTALVTESYGFASPYGNSDAVEEAINISTYLETTNWHATHSGDPIMVGDGPWLVAVANHITGNDFGADGEDGISVITVVDNDGTLLIARHEYMTTT